ncbi:hypothetical protein SCHPADRAFT_926401 [Schizopora paradoxa]|uniref:Uncharacterized protein n=1 Tax=Schizopora paradoxa TaxID=27342 RepID=A0A0H2RY83_9AGAM|nr:hypothetical protein SCHPADRAFT_926401 [Schizopora paradoxa]
MQYWEDHNEKIPAFEAESSTLAWLESFASKRDYDLAVHEHLKDVFPWFWNPVWGDSIPHGVEGVKEVRDAIGQAERIIRSLESFLACSKDRLGRLKANLKTVAARTYFPLLTDDILAIIFEFASFGETNGKPDYRTPSRISRVSRRFREVAAMLPRLRRFIDSGTQSLELLQELTSKHANMGPIFEVRMRPFQDRFSSVSDFSDDLQERKAENQALFFSHLATSLSSKITSLHLDYYLEFDYVVFEKLNERFQELSFPALEVLCINHEDPAFDHPDDLYVQFYRNWDLPALKVLKALNIVPRLRSEVLSGISECCLSIGRHPVDEANAAEWDLTTIMELLCNLSTVKILTLDLHGTLITAESGELPIVDLPTVEILSTSFVGVNFESAKEFRRAFSAPNKHSWTIEIEDSHIQGLLWDQLDDIFPYPKFTNLPEIPGMTSIEHFSRVLESNSPSGRARNGPNRTLTNVNLIIHRSFGRTDCNDIRRRVPFVVPNLENFSVTYANGEQGFFSRRDEESESTVQIRKVELKNCKGKVEDLLVALESKFAHEPYNGFSRIVLDGSGVEDSGGSSYSGRLTSGWSALVRNAKIIRDE